MNARVLLGVLALGLLVTLALYRPPVADAGGWDDPEIDP